MDERGRLVIFIRRVDHFPNARREREERNDMFPRAFPGPYDGGMFLTMIAGGKASSASRAASAVAAV